jgi:hypothetical protein
MPVLQLSAEEAQVLHSILENYFSELRMEIERTEAESFRSKLQAREQIVKKIIAELKP